MSFFDFRPASPFNEVLLERAESPPSAFLFSLEDTESDMMEENLSDDDDNNEMQFDGESIPDMTISHPLSPPTLPIVIRRKSPSLSSSKQPSIESILYARRGASSSPSTAKSVVSAFKRTLFLQSTLATTRTRQGLVQIPTFPSFYHFFGHHFGGLMFELTRKTILMAPRIIEKPKMMGLSALVPVKALWPGCIEFVWRSGEGRVLVEILIMPVNIVLSLIALSTLG